MMWMTALGFVRKVAGGVFTLVSRYPLQCALLASLCLSGWLWLGKREAISDRDALAVRLVQQKAEYVKAGEEARDAQLALRAKEQATFAHIAEGNKHEEAKRHSDILAAAERVRRERVCSRPANAQREGDPAPDDNGSSGGAELVAIPRDEWDKFIRNTERLELVHDFGNRLLDAGLAVKADPVPEVGF